MFFAKAIYCRVFQGAFRLVLPVLPYDRLEEVLERLQDGPKPLALHLFLK